MKLGCFIPPTPDCPAHVSCRQRRAAEQKFIMGGIDVDIEPAIGIMMAGYSTF
jgi:hypothetical protein